MNTSNNVPFIHSVKSISHPNRIDGLIIDLLEESAKSLYLEGSQITVENVVTLKNIISLEKGMLSIELLQTSLDKLSDTRHNHNQQVFIYFPILKAIDDKVHVQIALIPSNNNDPSNQEIENVIEKIFELSKPAVTILIKRLANIPLLIEKINYSQPGKILFIYDETKNAKFLPNRFSFQKQIVFFTNRAFKINPQYTFEIVDTNIFIQHLLKYALSNKLIEKIANNFYVIIDEIKVQPDGKYERAPEALLQYIILLDALILYTLKKLSTISQRKSWHEYTDKIKKILDETKEINWRHKDLHVFISLKEKLQEIIYNFPYDKLDQFDINQIDEYHKQCKYTLESLHNLEGVFQMNLIRKDDILLDQIIDSTLSFIASNTKQNKTVTIINPETIITNSSLQEKARNQTSSEQLLKKLQERFAYLEDPKEPSKFYFVDHGYLLLVQTQLANKATLSQESQFLLLKTKDIEQKYLDDPYLNSLLTNKQQSILKTQMYSDEKKVNSLNQQQKTNKHYDFTRGFFTIILSIIIYMILLLIYFDIWPLIFLLPLISYLGFLKKPQTFFTKLFTPSKEYSSKKKQLKSENIYQKISEEKKKSELTEKKSQFRKELSKNIEKYCIPNKINKLQERIITEKKLLENSEQIINNIENFEKARENNAYFLQEAERALKETYVSIPIPSRLISPTVPATVYINRTDFLSDMTREKISNEIRENIEISEQSQREYLKYLVNILEVEFYKYK